MSYLTNPYRYVVAESTYELPCPASPDGGQNTASNYLYGQRFLAGHVLIDKNVSAVSFACYKVPAATGTTQLEYRGDGVGCDSAATQGSNETPAYSSLPDFADARTNQTAFTFTPHITVEANGIFSIKNIDYGVITTTTGTADPYSELIKCSSGTWGTIASKPSVACSTWTYSG